MNAATTRNLQNLTGGSADVTALTATVTAHTTDSTDPHGATLTQTNITTTSISATNASVGALTISTAPTLDNTATQVLVRDTTSGVVERRDDISGNNETAVLTNKTISTTNNTLQIGATNITSLLGQDVRSTASPSFAQLTLTTGLLLPTSGGTPTNLSYYEELTITGNWTGPRTINSQSVFLTRIGRLVNIYVPSSPTVAASGAAVAFTFSTAVPTRFRGSGPFAWINALVNDGGVDKLGWLTLQGGGTLQIYRANNSLENVFASFAGSGTCGWYGVTLNLS